MFILDRKYLHLVIFKKPQQRPDRLSHTAEHHTQVQPAAHPCLSRAPWLFCGTLRVLVCPVLRSTITWQFSSEQGTRKQNTSSNSKRGWREGEGRFRPVNIGVTSHPQNRGFMLFVKTLVSWANLHIKGISVITGNCQDSVQWAKKGAHTLIGKHLLLLLSHYCACLPTQTRLFHRTWDQDGNWSSSCEGSPTK